MLELYHHGSSVCAAKVRFALAEKGVAVDRYHYVDILRGEQFLPAYRAINARAVVPTLLHDGHVVTESTLICEYVDDVFDGRALQPKDAYRRYRMRTWTKVVDELLHPACADVTFVCCHRHILKRMSPSALEAYFDNTPEQTEKGAWRARKRELVELDASGIAAKFRLYRGQLDEMERALRDTEWLASPQFSLADVALTPYVNRLAMLQMQGLWEGGRLPRVAQWFERICSRPTFRPALLDWCSPELTADLRTYGEESWLAVRNLLEI